MKRMSGRARRAVPLVGAALVIGTIAAAAVEGDFHGTLLAIEIAGVAAFVLIVAGSLLKPFPRTAAAGRFVLACGIVAVLVIPSVLLGERGVVELHVWRAKRYAAKSLMPRLEEHRRAHGRYPEELQMPREMKGFRYFSDGQAYGFSFMDPGICGLLTQYSSAAREWRRRHDPCFY